MKITRNVILDLLPLYQAGEISPDTKALVDAFLETDSDLAEIAKQKFEMNEIEDIPFPKAKEDQMEAYKQAQKLINQRTMIWAAIIAIALLAVIGIALLAFFMLTSVM